MWRRVFGSVGPPVLTACSGAAGAFLVAVLTDFRGAAELGIIAGGGLLLCLVSAYTVLPALLTLWPGKPRPAERPAPVDAGPQRQAKWRYFLLPGLWMAALLAGIPFAMRMSFNPNLLELQAPDLESVKLVGKIQTWSAVVLSKDLSMLRQVRQAVATAPTVGRTESILDAYDNLQWLGSSQGDLAPIQWSAPAPIDENDLSRLSAKARTLAERIEEATAGVTQPATDPTSATAALQAFASACADSQHPQLVALRLSAWQNGFIAQLREMLEQLSPTSLDVAKLPSGLRTHLLSDDGFHALYIYPRGNVWKRQPLARFVKEVAARVATVPGSPRITGIATNIHYSTMAVECAFYRATGYAAALIALLVLLDLRRLGQTLAALSVLALGLPMLVTLMGLLGISWNFANFFGLPILLGAAHEYGVFMLHRYREAAARPVRAWRRWDSSDRALLLCAFVTSSSFFFFWAMGHHRGLRSLGLVMALGSACIYLAAVLVVRPLLRLRLLCASRPSTGGPADEAGAAARVDVSDECPE